MSFQKKITIILGLIIVIFFGARSLNNHSDANIFLHSQRVLKLQDATNNNSDFDQLVLSYDTLLQHHMSEENIPGMAYAIVKDNQIIKIKGAGVKEFGSQDSVDIHTIFRIGSVSKGFASVLTALFVNEKKLNWDDKIVTYLPDFCLKDSSLSNQITIRNVLSHTTGLPTHTFTDMLDYNKSYEEIKPHLKDIPFAYKPGEDYSYQNVAYSLIGDVLQSVSGEDYNTLLRKRIFEPICMNQASSDYHSIVSDSNVAKPHICSGKKIWKPLPLNDRYYSVSPASGINASISDMAQWLLTLTSSFPDIISEETLAEVFKPQIYTPIKRNYRNKWQFNGDLYYGLGWRIFNYNGNTVIYHGGYVKGYRAEIAFNPKDKTGIVVLFNASSGLSNACIPEFWKLYYNTCTTAPLVAKIEN